MTDSDIIQALADRDEKAFALFVAQWQDLVYNTSLSMLQNSEEAEDVTQEVFIQIFETIGNFRQEASLKTWIYRITVNRSLDLLRKKKQWFSFSPGEKEIAAFDHPGVALAKKEDSRMLFKALKQLPRNQMAAFVLQQVEGLRVDEIGLALGITTKAAESLLSRARQKLQKLLKNYYSQ